MIDEYNASIFLIRCNGYGVDVARHVKHGLTERSESVVAGALCGIRSGRDRFVPGKLPQRLIDAGRQYQDQHRNQNRQPFHGRSSPQCFGRETGVRPSASDVLRRAPFKTTAGKHAVPKRTYPSGTLREHVSRKRPFASLHYIRLFRKCDTRKPHAIDAGDTKRSV
ncbi:hypothetical protein Sfum_1068 [Syntrophobacter fumaroxidans MPOB]|uniref:Uncharacterized protein n=1 Tax=Syntrophobacter fumaroxidans (strain DSM 10017 / MPOB) TaxID=335543 RepID=A0LH60_SYNFM|nr:hypothetical protein Sfum_1068 [Syntrophobacter fumaroxidans MPOB]